MKEENKEMNNCHSRVSLSGISALEKKVVEVPDNNLRVRQYNNTTQTPDKSFPGWNKAFTLIELLVVVLIIGILSAIALPQYQKAVYKARAVEAKVNLAAIANAQQTFYLANGYYTNDLESLDIEVKNTSSVSYSCNINTTPHNADCWAHMSLLRFNFSVTPNSISHFCVGEKNSLGESICKGEGAYTYDTQAGDASYYEF